MKTKLNPSTLKRGQRVRPINDFEPDYGFWFVRQYEGNMVELQNQSGLICTDISLYKEA